MKRSFKRFYATLLAVAFIICSIVPITAFAKAGTLGQEKPAITCTFKNASNETVDGNKLTAGNYTVNIVLSGMASLSAFQLTAVYQGAISSLQIASIYSDNANSQMISMGGPKNEDGRIVFGFASVNDDTTVINSDGIVVAVLNVTISADCDFEDVFIVSADPDLTCAMADFGDGYDDCYVLDTSISTTYNTYEMTCDVSPKMGPDEFNVTGQIKIATDLTGTETTEGITGITVSIDGTDISATTDADGNYTLENVPIGEYTVTISGPTTIDRTVSLVVSEDKVTDNVITVAPVGIIVCDYNKDEKVNAYDKLTFNQSYNDTENYNVYCDLNVDEKVNTYDKLIFNVFYNGEIQYADVAL